jgi:outer membrane biosynthesis protein TonB
VNANLADEARQMKILLSLLLITLATAFATAQTTAVGTDPKLIDHPAPLYPQTIRTAGFGGHVTVLVLIDKKGKAKVVDSFGPAAPCSNLDDAMATTLRTAAEEAAAKATFVPATWKGKPVEKGMRLNYHFDPRRENVSAGDGSDPDVVNSGFLNGRAINLAEPKYPTKAQGVVSGGVDVNVIVFEDGMVHYAGAVSGHKTLRRATVEAACRSTFRPVLLAGKPVKFSGVISWAFYNVYRRD